MHGQASRQEMRGTSMHLPLLLLAFLVRVGPVATTALVVMEATARTGVTVRPSHRKTSSRLFPLLPLHPQCCGRLHRPRCLPRPRPSLGTNVQHGNHACMHLHVCARAVINTPDFSLGSLNSSTCPLHTCTHTHCGDLFRFLFSSWREVNGLNLRL